VGKTRLAHEVAKQFGEEFPDGIWFVDLTAIRDPVGVPADVA
jgi:predicted ATPase